MSISLENYHSWKSEIYDKSDGVLFDEIVKCIDAKAYRAANIMICISFTESLLKKLEILSESNKQIAKDLKNYHKERKDFLLIEYAKKYDLITELEHAHLNIIMDARNNFAHPTFESPTKNQVISYLYFAVQYVLKRPPYYSFLYAKSLIENHLATDQYYWEGKNNIQIQNYANNFFKRLDANSFNSVLKLLFKSLENLYIDFNQNKSGCINNCLIYLNVLLSLDEMSLTEDEVNDYLDKYRHASCHIFTYGNNWISLDSRSKSRIFNYASDFENGIFSESEFINIFYPLYEAHLLENDFSFKFREILDEISLESLIYCDVSSDLYFKKIIGYFKMHIFGYQNTAMKVLYEIDLDQFNDLELEEIGRNILQSADGNAWDCIDFIDYFYDEKNVKFHNINLVQGILNEAFVNEKGYFRYKPNSVRRVLLMIQQYSMHDEILDNLLSNIESSKPKNDDFIKFNQAKYFLNRLKDKNSLISSDIELIISSINKSICSSINAIFEKDYKQLLDYNNYSAITPHIYRCLNETKRELFSKLAYDDPLDFIRFFSKVKRYVENKENKVKVEIRFDLIEKFINPINIKKNVQEISLEKLSLVDRMIIEEFLCNIS